MKTIVQALLLAAAAAAALPVHADSLRDYLIRAIDAGEVSGPIDDATARAWQERSGSSMPVMVRVIPIKDFKQEGCKRLAIGMWQDGVPTKEGKQIRFGVPMEMNLCRDGTPPLEAVNPETLKAAIEAARTRREQAR